VAVKVLHPDQARDPLRCERFSRGARVMAGLTHEGVVRVLQAHGEDGGYRYFAMELIDGEDLHRAVIGERLPAEEAMRPILRVGDASPGNDAPLVPVTRPYSRRRGWGLPAGTPRPAARLSVIGALRPSGHRQRPERLAPEPVDHRTRLLMMRTSTAIACAGYERSICAASDRELRDSGPEGVREERAHPPTMCRSRPTAHDDLRGSPLLSGRVA
jgi:hypothetical protein